MFYMVYLNNLYYRKKMSYYYRWGYRYPCFLAACKEYFMGLRHRHKEWYREFGDMDPFTVIVNDKKIYPEYVWNNNQKNYPTVICKIPDGAPGSSG